MIVNYACGSIDIEYSGDEGHLQLKLLANSKKMDDWGVSRNVLVLNSFTVYSLQKEKIFEKECNNLSLYSKVTHVRWIEIKK